MAIGTERASPGRSLGPALPVLAPAVAQGPGRFGQGALLPPRFGQAAMLAAAGPVGALRKA